MSSGVEQGTCDYCKYVGPINRKYFYYPIKCDCHSPQHFEIVYHCNNCTPKAPMTTTIILKTCERGTFQSELFPDAGKGVEDCKHSSWTFNEDIGLNVCDGCNKTLKMIRDEIQKGGGK